MDWDISYDDFKVLLEAVKNTFYNHSGTLYYSYSAIPEVSFKIMPDLSIKTYKENRKIEETINYIISKILYDGISEKEAVRHIYDYLRKNLTYTENVTGLYNALVNKKAICSGYALAFQHLCNYVGIECEYVSGYAYNGLHAWNKVKVDGKWYYSDPTWNDNDRYFLSETLWNDHTLI